MCSFELVLSGFLFYITIWEDALDALLLWSWTGGWPPDVSPVCCSNKNSNAVLLFFLRETGGVAPYWLLLNFI